MIRLAGKLFHRLRPTAANISLSSVISCFFVGCFFVCQCLLGEIKIIIAVADQHSLAVPHGPSVGKINTSKHAF